MDNKTSLKLALGTTFAAGLALGIAQAADNPFAATKLDSGYLQLADNKASGEMKCGAGMCGGNMKKADAKAGDDMKCPADTNEDGMVTKEEFMTYHEKMFDEADANKDGSLDAAERKVLHGKMMEGRCGSKADDAKPDDAAGESKTEDKK